MLVLFCIRGCGRIERPAFPAPSLSKGERFMHGSSEFTPRECKGVSDECERARLSLVIARLAALAKTSAGPRDRQPPPNPCADPARRPTNSSTPQENRSA